MTVMSKTAHGIMLVSLGKQELQFGGITWTILTMLFKKEVDVNINRLLSPCYAWNDGEGK